MKAHGDAVKKASGELAVNAWREMLIRKAIPESEWTGYPTVKSKPA